jgi:hypothetical protein
MAAKSERILELETFLDDIEEAIRAVLTRGQRVQVNGQQYTRADLGELRQLRTEARRELGRARTGGMRIRQVVPRG